MALVAAFAVPAVADATTWYVDPLHGSNSHAGTSPSTAFQTASHAYSHTGGGVSPGDTVVLMAVTSSGAVVPLANIGIYGPREQNGTAAHFGTSSNHVHWVGGDANGNPLTPNTDISTSLCSNSSGGSSLLPIFSMPSGAGTNVVVQIKGGNTGSTPGSGINGIFMDFTCISFQGTTTPGSRYLPSQRGSKGPISGVYINTSSDIWFQNVEVAYTGGDGLGTEATENIFVDHSWFHDNAYDIPFYDGVEAYGSALSYLRGYDWYNYTSGASVYSTQVAFGITNSRFWNNYNDTSTCTSGEPCSPTDGEAIELDRNDGSCEGDLGPCTSDDPGTGADNHLPPFTAKILVANNQIWQSGGPGINSYLTAGLVDILGNSLYLNNFKSTNSGSNQGEISLSGAAAPPTTTGGVASPLASQNYGARVIGNIGYFNSSFVRSNNSSAHARCIQVENNGQTSLNGTYTPVGSPSILKNNLCYDVAGSTSYTTYFTSNKTTPALSTVNGNGTTSAILLGNPLYTSPSTSSSANFQLSPTSPAFGFIAASTSEYLSPDTLGVARVQSDLTAGAFQGSSSTTSLCHR
jgi:hypothetical protein